jgi:hypothetical protein
MSKIAIEGNASGTGTFTIASPNSNSSRTLSLPDGTGTFVVNGINSSIVSGTSVASTSGTSIDFTGIPSWVKRITVMFDSVSLNGEAHLLVRAGSGSFETTGYASTSTGTTGSAGSSINDTTGFVVRTGGNLDNITGVMVLNLFSGSTWVSSHTCKYNVSASLLGGGRKAFSGTIDRVRITTTNGTDTFDAGSINILYE